MSLASCNNSWAIGGVDAVYLVDLIYDYRDTKVRITSPFAGEQPLTLYNLSSMILVILVLLMTRVWQPASRRCSPHLATVLCVLLELRRDVELKLCITFLSLR